MLPDNPSLFPLSSLSLVSTAAIADFNLFPLSLSRWLHSYFTENIQAIRKENYLSLLPSSISLLKSKTSLPCLSPVTCFFSHLKVVPHLGSHALTLFRTLLYLSLVLLYCSTTPSPAPSQLHWNWLRSLHLKNIFLRNLFFRLLLTNSHHFSLSLSH